MGVTVSPAEFTLVDFDAAEITAIAERLCDEIGLPPGLAIEIQVDESTPTGRVATASLDPLHLTVEGGAMENPKRLRTLSEDNAVDALGLAFFQARDRLDPAFGAPPLGADLSLAERVTWDVFTMGRLARLGHRAQRTRHLYHFRNYHGFTDAADAAFEVLWAGDATTWSELLALSAGARAALTPG